MINVSVTLNYEIPERDIDTLIEMAGYGVAYWAYAAYFDDDQTFTVKWRDTEEQTKTVTYQQLAEALVKVAQEYRNYIGRYARDYFTELMGPEGKYAAGAIDSELADVVVQYAVLGEHIYG